MDSKKNDNIKQTIQIKKESRIIILNTLFKRTLTIFGFPFLLRKCQIKLSKKQFRIFICIAGTIFVGISIVLYNLFSHLNYQPHVEWEKVTPRHNVVGTPMRHIPLDVVYQDIHREEDDFETINKNQRFMINTPGCRIPVAMIKYKNQSKEGNKTNKLTCGVRGVELIRNFRDGRITIFISDALTATKAHTKFSYCCVRFVNRFLEPSQKVTAKYTSCIKVKDRSIIDIQSDIINIQCFGITRKNSTQLIYDDFYAFVKKINNTKKPKVDKTKYNVLILGVDTMSLSRFAQTMDRTVKYLKDNFWLGFRGYHKVAYNTLPNLMAAFSGKSSEFTKTHCVGNMDKCNQYVIWSNFKKSGYVTAFAEDLINLPDSLSKHFNFQTPPTDHHMHFLFIKGERKLDNGTLFCAGKKTSGQQILDYAFDFATTYIDEAFFGIFWINSFSHENYAYQKDADKTLENFLNRLSYTGISKNTFLIFMSDHGVQYGDTRIKIESYYEQRLPFLFILPPAIFKGKYPHKYSAAVFNQFRLTNHYDLYKTLIEIHDLSSNTSTFCDELYACAKCHSLFKPVRWNRTCQDADISEAWCSCHLLYPLDNSDVEGVKSVLHAVAYIQSMAEKIPTKDCWTCKKLTLQKILRIHFYYSEGNTKLYHLVAFSTLPLNVSFEMKVLSQPGGERLIVGPVQDESLITSLPKQSNFCTVNLHQGIYCDCQRKKSCAKQMNYSTNSYNNRYS